MRKNKLITLIIFLIIIISSIACDQPAISVQSPPISPTNDSQHLKESAGLLAARGEYLIKTGDYGMAIEVLEQAIETFPEYKMYWDKGVAHEQMATELMGTSRLGESIFHLKQACKDLKRALHIEVGVTDYDLNTLNNDVKECEAQLQRLTKP